MDNGLILRCLKDSDKDSLFNHLKQVFEDSNINPGTVIAVKQILEYFPQFSLQDYFVVIDTSQDNRVIASLCLLRHKCVFETVEISYGQLEMVGTNKEYRNRGLIRHLINAAEERALEYDLSFLVIYGIPYYYKTFGYEYAIPLAKHLNFPTERILPLKENEKEISHITKVCNGNDFKLYNKIRSKKNSHLQIYRQLPDNIFPFYNISELSDSEEAKHFYLVKNNDKVIGIFYVTSIFRCLRIRDLYVKDISVIPIILRFVKKLAFKYHLPLNISEPAQLELIPYLEEIAGSKFTWYYAWYAKILSIKKFFQKIRPIIEYRLKQSVYHQLTDIIRISYYRGGFELIFQKGELTSINELRITEITDSVQPIDLRIPFRNLTQLLMGYKTIDMLEKDNPDISYSGNRKHFLDTLFPSIKASLIPTE